jgi:hypothetical protein
MPDVKVHDLPVFFKSIYLSGSLEVVEEKEKFHSWLAVLLQQLFFEEFSNFDFLKIQKIRKNLEKSFLFGQFFPRIKIKKIFCSKNKPEVGSNEYCLF